MITMDDSYKFSDFGFIELTGNEEPLTPEYDNKQVKIPGRVGYWDFGNEINSKSFPVNIGMSRKIPQNKEIKLDRLKNFLTDDFGNPRLIKFVFSYAPDKFMYAKLGVRIPINRVIIGQELQLNFIADDPSKYARFLPEEITWGSKVIDFTFPYRFGLGRNGEGGLVDEQVTTPQIISVTAEGLAVKPILILEGSGTNVSISNNESVINIGTFANATWEIDCINYISYKNGVETFLNMNEFWLMPSVNQLKIAGTGLNFKFSVKFRNRYL